MRNRLEENPGAWMFLAGLGGFTVAALVFYVLKVPAAWPAAAALMAVFILMAERRIKRCEQAPSGPYGLYVRLAGYALAWPFGWFFLFLMTLFLGA